MADLPAVLVKEPCPDCNGAGKIRVQMEKGDSKWMKSKTCERCDGEGTQNRWVPVSEAARMLREAEEDDPAAGE